MKNTTGLALIRIFALTVLVMAGIFIVPKVAAHPDGGAYAGLSLALVAGGVVAPKAAIYELTKDTLPQFITDIAKAVGDPFYQEFIFVSKDAAAVMEQLRFDAGLSEQDAAKSLGCTPADYLNFVKSGKGLEVTADSMTAFCKAVSKGSTKISVAELAAKMVSGGDEPDADDQGTQTGNQAGASQTMNNNAQPAGGAGAQNPNPAAKAAGPASGQIISVRAPGGSSGFAVNKSGELINVAKDKTGNIIKSSDGTALSMDVLKMNFAGVRNDINVQKTELAPSDLLNGGVFIPTEAKGIIDLMFSDSSILSTVQTFQLPTKKMQVQSHEASNLRLNRLGTGWSNAKQKGVSSFMSFDLQRVTLEFEILDETVALFANNVAGLENFIYSMYREAFMNRIAYLGWNGASDSADDAVVASGAEATLSTGWFVLAAAQCAAGMKLTSATYLTKYEQFKALITAQLATEANWNTNEQQIFCSEVDFNSYVDELEQRLDGTAFLGMSPEQMKNMTFRGKKFNTQNWIPSGSFLMSKPSNLGFATLAGDQGGLKVGRYSQPGSTIYRVEMWIDFGLQNAAKQIVLSV